jgi:hypothetical protein
LLGTSGVESGKAAPLVGGPPGVELHTVVDELPSGDTGDVVPVVLPASSVGMVPNGAAGTIAVDDIVVLEGAIVAVLPAMDVGTVLATVDSVGTGVTDMEGAGRAGTAGGGGTGTVEPGNVDKADEPGCADSVNSGAVVLPVVDVEEVAVTADIVDAVETDGVVPIVPPNADMEVTGTAAVPGAICPVGVEQITTVPGVVGSEASGTGASVVSEVPGWVVAENGLGPLSGDVTIVPGVDGRPMAVLPMMETCARPALQPASRMAVVNSKRRIATPSTTRRSSLSAPCAPCAPRPCCPPPGSPSD